MEQFSNACYHPKVFRDWKASLVKSRLSLWCIRRIPCILGSLIYDCRLTTQRPGPAFLLSLLCGLGWEEFPDPYYLSYLGLPKDNSPWKHFLLSLVFFKRPRLCLQGTVTDINSFHLSDLGADGSGRVRASQSPDSPWLTAVPSPSTCLVPST